MDHLCDSLQTKITSYCDVKNILYLSQINKKLHKNTNLGICLPQALYRYIFGFYIKTHHLRFREYIVKTEINQLSVILKDDPTFKCQLWLKMSDKLYNEDISHRMFLSGSFKRPSTGYFPDKHFYFLEEAKQLKFWKKKNRKIITTIGTHEIYRLNRLRLRTWKKEAPLAISLIY